MFIVYSDMLRLTRVIFSLEQQ